jgi:hypothetical protein
MQFTVGVFVPSVQLTAPQAQPGAVVGIPLEVGMILCSIFNRDLDPSQITVIPAASPPKWKAQIPTSALAHPSLDERDQDIESEAQHRPTYG